MRYQQSRVTADKTSKSIFTLPPEELALSPWLIFVVRVFRSLMMTFYPKFSRSVRFGSGTLTFPIDGIPAPYVGGSPPGKLAMFSQMGWRSCP
jgi:hypothetical protein